MTSGHGDSGSPIWNLSKSSSDSTVILAGVLWGGPGDTTWYSPFGRVVDELYWGGNVTVVANSPYVVDSVPPPYGVDLSAPNTMRPDVVCYATATAYDGTAPYIYQWSTGFADTTAGSSYGGFDGGTISVTVTDAQSAQVYASAYTEIDQNANSNCEF
jgi:hypothetical protein